MNTQQEQAYINGFVKRAAEYGFSENESTQLAKEAMRGARAVNLGFGLKMRPIAEEAVRDGILNIPKRGTPDAQRLAKLLRQIKVNEKTLPPQKIHPLARLTDMRIKRKALMPDRLGRSGQNLHIIDDPRNGVVPNEAMRMMMS